MVSGFVPRDGCTYCFKKHLVLIRLKVGCICSLNTFETVQLVKLQLRCYFSDPFSQSVGLECVQAKAEMVGKNIISIQRKSKF